jgi:hypothetical protein
MIQPRMKPAMPQTAEIKIVSVIVVVLLFGTRDAD